MFRASILRAGSCALALAGVGLSLAASPSGISTAVADEAAAPADPAIAGGVAEALRLEGDVEAGRRAWASCAICHLPSGAGRPDGTFPQLAGQHRSVVIKQLVDIREGRRANPVMEPHAQALLDSQELADVAAYVETLPVPTPTRGGDGGDLGRGEQLYRRDCASCHGPQGHGDADRFVPVLAGQHYAYLLRQIRSIAARRRDNAHLKMERVLKVYTDGELRAVVDYASRLPVRRSDEQGP